MNLNNIIIIQCIVIICILIANNLKSNNIETFWSPDDNHIKGQKAMTDMFRKINGICRKHNIKYWCSGGTLIGTLRHKGWIPWDIDIDICMLKEDYTKLQSIIQDELKDTRYMFQDKTVDTNYTLNIGKIRYLDAVYVNGKNDKISMDGTHHSGEWHHGLQIDIFVFRKKGEILSAPYEGKGDIKSISNKIIFPLKELYFDNISVYVPNNYKKYCKDAWGDYPPPFLSKEKQHPHEGPIIFKIPEWMLNKYSNYYPKNIKYINYKGLDILFPNEKLLQDPGEQVWVNYTGLNTDRPDIIFNEINSFMKITPGMKILDIGCGAGELAIEFYIKYKDSIKYLGIDVVNKLLQINQINMKEYLFINGKDFSISKKYDIIMFMGYGHSLNEYMNSIVELTNTQFIILESHTGKSNDFNKYNSILSPKYKIIYDKILNCGDIPALKRRMVIYKLI